MSPSLTCIGGIRALWTTRWILTILICKWAINTSSYLFSLIKRGPGAINTENGQLCTLDTDECSQPATVYCDVCDVYMCEQCERYHDGSKLARKHKTMPITRLRNRNNHTVLNTCFQIYFMGIVTDWYVIHVCLKNTRNINLWIRGY